MKRKLTALLIVLTTLLTVSCQDEDSIYMLDGEWNVKEMNSLNEEGEILNTIAFNLGESVITIDGENYKETVNMTKGDKEVNITSTGTCTRTGNTYEVSILESTNPQLKGQQFTLQFTLLVRDSHSTYAEIYSRSGDIIRTGKLVRL